METRSSGPALSASRRSPCLTAARAAARLASLAPLALLAVAAACGGEKAPAGTPAAVPDASYAVRGEIVRLPGADSTDIWIRHEPVPDFENPNGEVVGMDSMTMPFALAAGESLTGLTVGTRVEFRLEMRWSGGAPASVSGLKALPPGTRLSFDPPAGGAPPAATGAAPEDGDQGGEIPK